MRVLSYGEILWDIINEQYHLGGAPFNFAAHFARTGAESYMISRVGDDDLGEKVLSQMKILGVKSGFIQVDSQFPTGTVNVFLENGQPNYTINPQVAYDYIDLEELHKKGITNQDFDVFGFGTLVQRNEASRHTLMALLKDMSFQHIFYDVNLRKDCYAPAYIKDSLAFATILKLSDEEVPLVAEMIYGEEMDIAAFCKKTSADYHQEIIIVTAGGAGCYIYHNSHLHHIPTEKIVVVDTVGAGDSFSAAFLATFFKKGDPVLAASVANQVGAFVASSAGPIPVYSDKIKKLLEIN